METKDEKPTEDKILEKDEKPETTAKEITDKEVAEKEAIDKENKAKAEKELAEKETKTKAKKEKKAEAARKRRAAKKKAASKEPAFKIKRIRMLMSIANEKVAYTAGAVYEVGKDITLDDAEKRLREGVAELDASAVGPSETK
ncbi:unnamed protein product [marine sediment metagenome]|uniref:Uncharacterized protein n=1 Tax=marine sediment metagenome TaxID=412755 RepID=X1GQ38_9ZZZZ